jgi:exopolyphosphatase/guanosine-5'-triphosphate,3'-diphosphate pyrophosphatase
MISSESLTLYKLVKTTRLAEGMLDNNMLTVEAIKRTVSAVSFFVDRAKEECVENVYIFATAATRKAKNRDEFLSAVRNTCGYEVDVVSGEVEARLGYVGALNGRDGGIIDVGGASTEVTVVDGGRSIYTKSIELGAVSLTDRCGQDMFKADRFVEEKILEYGNVPMTKFYSIGGTATSIAAMLQELDPYDPNMVDGYTVSIDQLCNLKQRLYSLSVEERAKLKGLQPERAKVIANGVNILLKLMNRFCIDSITVSEKDNLEGYLKLKLEKV